MMIFQDFRFLFASKKAALLVNPFLIKDNEQEFKLRRVMNFRERDFKWNKELLLNFSVEYPRKSILSKFEKIILENAL